MIYISLEIRTRIDFKGDSRTHLKNEQYCSQIDDVCVIGIKV